MIDDVVVVSDSNIFFDLLSSGLLNEFFRLPCKIATTDFVVDEIMDPDQKRSIDLFIRTKELNVESFGPQEVLDIVSIFEKNSNNASITDCSVWYYAKKTNGRLLTGDAKLRRSAMKDNVKVSGFLYVLDNLVEYGLVDKKVCAERLEHLLEINKRLPKEECVLRIKSWRSLQ